MTSKSSLDVADKLKRLQLEFHARLPERITSLRESWHDYIKDGQLEHLKKIQLEAHSLTGSALTFNAEELGKIARELELSLLSFINEQTKPGDVQQLELKRKLESLEQIAAVWRPGDIYVKDEFAGDNNKLNDNSLVYFIEDDELFANKLTLELESQGYTVEHFTNVVDLEKTCQTKLPSVILMDMVLGEEHLAGADVLKKLAGDNHFMPPVVFLSVRDDIESRLAAQRAGATRYYVKPVDTTKLISSLDTLTNRKLKEPYRVLVIDDNEDLSKHYSSILNWAGIRTIYTNDPLTVFDVIDEFQPELILMDLYMPGCTGAELAGVMRQDDAWMHVPIVFLSSEQDQGKQLSALQFGGDDFISKPVSPGVLVGTVQAKLRRARVISNLSSELQTSLNESNSLRKALDKHDLVSITDDKGIITYANDLFCQVSGYSHAELMGQNHNILNSGHHDRVFFQILWKTISSGLIWHGEVCNRDKDGNYYWVASTIVPYLDLQGKPYQYVSIRTDITRIKKIQTELIKAKEEAEQANLAKSQFLSSMSHELRTPMNAIIGFGQLLQMETGQALTVTQKDNVEEIVKAGRHLLELINEVLDLSRIEAGHVNLALEPVLINDVIPECIGLIQPIAQQRGISLFYVYNNKAMTFEECQNINTVVYTDRVRLKQSLLNLLSNAVKYNHDNGKITISCTTDDAEYFRINVVDTGPGISQKQQLQLFKPFNRLGADNSEIEGTGIGLVITKKLVEIMGGRIGMESIDGQGSTFWIDIPVCCADQLMDQSDPDELSSVSIPALKALIAENDYTILYVEDNAANIRLVTQILEQRPNVKLLSARDSYLGYAMVSEYLPDLVLMDISMPGMDGFKLLEQLKKNNKTRNIPVIAISAKAMPDDVTVGMVAGFNSYITKPIDVNMFLNSIDQILKTCKRETIK